MFGAFAVVILFLRAKSIIGAKLDLIDCGVDSETEVLTGDVLITDYPWFGILYYINEMQSGETRAVTMVTLIHESFVIGSAADIGPMPKSDFRKNSRVLLGERWNGVQRGVASYLIHPEYDQTRNTIALVHLKDPISWTKEFNIRALCPPPDFIRDPKFYVVKFKDDYNTLQKEVIPVIHVPGDLCKEFYIAANLYDKKMRPRHVVCAMALEDARACVWLAGAALVMRDHWGRWTMLGVGVRGPGCGAPSRYLDMMSYYPWVEASLGKFSRLTISQISKQKYVLRASDGESRTLQRFGSCDREERRPELLIYRELIKLWTDNTQYQFLTYNMTIVESIEYSCVTLELVNASASSEMRVKHYCPRESYGEPCHYYRGSTFDVSVFLMFSDQCRFEMFAYGIRKTTKLLDIHEHKLEEGTYYEDFALAPVEYKGYMEQTEVGFEPTYEKIWNPEYDLWTTTVFDPNATTSTLENQDFFNSQEKPADDFKQDVATTWKPETAEEDSDDIGDMFFGYDGRFKVKLKTYNRTKY